MIRTEIINPNSTNYVILTALKGDKYVSSAYPLTEDGEFQSFIANEKTAYNEQRAKVNHDVLVALYTQKEHVPHDCDFCGKPYADKIEYLTKKYGKEMFLCTTCYDVHVRERT